MTFARFPLVTSPPARIQTCKHDVLIRHQSLNSRPTRQRWEIGSKVEASRDHVLLGTHGPQSPQVFLARLWVGNVHL